MNKIKTAMKCAHTLLGLQIGNVYAFQIDSAFQWPYRDVHSVVRFFKFLPSEERKAFLDHFA